jgi:hypothetical protein
MYRRLLVTLGTAAALLLVCAPGSAQMGEARPYNWAGAARAAEVVGGVLREARDSTDNEGMSTVAGPSLLCACLRPGASATRWIETESDVHYVFRARVGAGTGAFTLELLGADGQPVIVAPSNGKDCARISVGPHKAARLQLRVTYTGDQPTAYIALLLLWNRSASLDHEDAATACDWVLDFCAPSDDKHECEWRATEEGWFLYATMVAPGEGVQAPPEELGPGTHRFMASGYRDGADVTLYVTDDLGFPIASDGDDTPATSVSLAGPRSRVSAHADLVASPGDRPAWVIIALLDEREKPVP